MDRQLDRQTDGRTDSPGGFPSLSLIYEGRDTSTDLEGDTVELKVIVTGNPLRVSVCLRDRVTYSW